MHAYELLYVLKPDLTDEARAALVAKFAGLITGPGGTVDKTDEWGKRRLPYPINYINEGFFYIVNFTAPGNCIAELERNLRISEAVMRSMVVRTDLRKTKKDKEAQA